MRELKNGIKIIGTDLGYGNSKGSNVVIPSGVICYNTEPIFQGNILKYNNNYYRVGEGHKPFLIDKTMDEEFYILNLAVIAREMIRAGIDSAKVYLATGLPLTWVRSQRERFREYLIKNKEITFRFNDRDFYVEIIGCSIYPQGYPAVVERISDFKGDIILVDIGNGTMNILYICNKKPIESKAWTEKLGVNQLVIRTKNEVMNNFGVKIDESTIERYLRFGRADISERYITLFHEQAVKYTEDIFTTLKAYDYNPEIMKLYIIGGGGCIIKNFADYDKERVEIISDICAAAKGYEYLAEAKLRRDGVI